VYVIFSNRCMRHVHSRSKSCASSELTWSPVQSVAPGLRPTAKSDSLCFGALSSFRALSQVGAPCAHGAPAGPPAARAVAAPPAALARADLRDLLDPARGGRVGNVRRGEEVVFACLGTGREIGETSRVLFSQCVGLSPGTACVCGRFRVIQPVLSVDRACRDAFYGRGVS
jgi:hypothetical protein